MVKKILLLIVCPFLIAHLYGNGGIGYKGLKLNLNGSTSWYNVHNVSWVYQGCGDYGGTFYNSGNSNWAGVNLGTFTTTAPLSITGYAVVGWTDNSDYVAGRLQYKIWKQGNTEPSTWSIINIGNYDNPANGATQVVCTNGNDRIVGYNNNNTSFNPGSEGTYNFKVQALGRMQYTGGGGGSFNDNNGIELTATFVISPPPTISSFTPSSGYVGNTISISGANFLGATTVKIGGANVNFTINNANSISAIVTAGAITGSISVTTPDGTATSSSNYTFNGYISSQAGDWNTAGTWLGGAVPPSNANITIDHSITVNSSVSNAPISLTINSGKSITFGTNDTLTTTNLYNNGTLDMTAGGTLSISSGGTISNGTSNFIKGNGMIIFSGSGTVSGTINFNNVTISGGVNFGTNSAIHGTLQINAGGFVNTNPPFYETNSTLKYNISSIYNRSTEWSTTSGAGCPYNVTIANNTTLDYPNSGSSNFTMPFVIGGNLTIETGSNFYMDYGTGLSSGTLTINGNIDIAGNLSLGDGIGGDLILKGNWTKTGGTFAHNNRQVSFEGTNNSTITNSNGETFAFLKLNKTNPGTNILDIACNVTVTTNLELSSGLLAIANNTLTLDGNISGTPGNSCYIATNGTGTLKKKFTGTGLFSFPIGDGAYAPISLDFSSGTFNSAYVSVRTDNTKHGSNISNTHYINRHWVVNQTGITGFNCQVVCNYTNGDIPPGASEANIYCGKFNGSIWTLGNLADAANNTLTFSNNTSFSDFTGGELSAMPVSWLFFNCKPDKNHINLTWGVSEEPATGIYTIERSIDGRNWEAIGTKTPSGQSFTTTSYHFADLRPLLQAYYRIKHTENLNEIQYSEMCFAQMKPEEKPKIKMDVTNNQIIVSLPTLSENTSTISLYDLCGRKLKHILATKTHGRITTSDLPSGIYELIIEHPGYRHAEKILIFN